MSSGSKKKENALQAQSQAAITAVAEKTPLQVQQEKQLADWTAWQNQAGAKDITSAPGMSNYLDIYGNANTMAQKQRVGDPGHAFTANLPGFNNQLQQQLQENLYNTRAQGLNQAFQGTRNEAMGAGASAAEMDMNRRNAYAQDQSQLYSTYLNRPQRPALWQQIAQVAVGGLGAATGAGGLFGTAKGLLGK